METLLVLDEITDKIRNELGRLDKPFVPVGRDPGPEGIPLPSKSISRVHAHFVLYNSTWFFVDNGSTNGSWVNGVKVISGRHRLVRPGTVIQLADKAFQLSAFDSEGKKTQKNLWAIAGDENAGGRSVFLFRDNEFCEEYAAPLFTRAVSVGGSQTDIQLPEYEGLRPALVIEDRNREMFAVSMSKQEPFSVNGRECIDNVELTDNDIVCLRDMVFLLNAPLESLDPVMAEETSAAEILDSVGIRSWQDDDDIDSGTHEVPTWRDENKPKLQSQSVFGQVDDSKDDDPYLTTGFGQVHHRSGAFPKVEEAQSGLDKLEDKLLLVVGLIMLLALVGIVGWWLIKISG